MAAGKNKNVNVVSLGAAPQGSSDNVCVELCDVNGSALAWNDVSYTTVTRKYLDTCEQVCAEEIPPEADRAKQGNANDRVCISFFLEPQRAALVDIAAFPSQSAGMLSFPSVIMSVGCKEKLPLKIWALPQAVARVQPKKRKIVIDGRWSGHRCGETDRSRPLHIESATATYYSVDPGKGTQEPHGTSHAVVQGSTATFHLIEGHYRLQFKLKEHFAGSVPSLPHTLIVGDADAHIPIWFEPCERTVTLLFVNACGHPEDGVDFHVEGEGALPAINQQGMLTFSPTKTGRLRLISHGFHLKPEEIHVDERMAQAHVIEALPKRHVLAGPRDEEAIVLDLVELLEENQIAIVKLLTLDGAMLASQPAAKLEPARFEAKYDFPILLEAFVNGQPICQLIHQPHS